MNISLQGKVAVVTGAASGIGLAVARRYLECDVDGLVAVDVAPIPEELAALQGGARRVVSGEHLLRMRRW